MQVEIETLRQEKEEAPAATQVEMETLRRENEQLLNEKTSLKESIENFASKK